LKTLPASIRITGATWRIPNFGSTLYRRYGLKPYREGSLDLSRSDIWLLIIPSSSKDA
jgi:hypothetical protein